MKEIGAKKPRFRSKAALASLGWTGILHIVAFAGSVIGQPTRRAVCSAFPSARAAHHEPVPCCPR